MASVSEVFVHIGPLKTGTTYIQAVLYQNRKTLASTAWCCRARRSASTCGRCST